MKTKTMVGILGKLDLDGKKCLILDEGRNDQPDAVLPQYPESHVPSRRAGQRLRIAATPMSCVIHQGGSGESARGVRMSPGSASDYQDAHRRPSGPRCCKQTKQRIRLRSRQAAPTSIAIKEGGRKGVQRQGRRSTHGDRAGQTETPWAGSKASRRPGRRRSSA